MPAAEVISKYRARQGVVEAASSLLNDSRHPVEVCRTIMQLSVPAELEDSEDLDVIRGIESQTQDYPLGNLRRQYETAYLERLDAEIDAFLSAARQGLEEACRSLIGSLSGPRPT
jgi:hypothetical protein